MPLHRYYTLGDSGLRVSRLALGTMTFGEGEIWAAQAGDAEAIFNAYVDAGGNFIDTADIYNHGNSERLVGELISKRNLRDQLVLSTKYTFNMAPDNPNAGGNGRKNLIRAVDASLQRLGTDFIDLYFLHVWDRITPAEEVIDTMNDLIRAGKIRHYGLSDVPAWYASRVQAITELRGLNRPIALQLEYSLAERSIEDEFVPFGLRHGLGIMAWSPLNSGLLSGKYKPSDSRKFGDGRLQMLVDQVPQAAAKFSPHNWNIIGELHRVAAEVERSVAQVAINWVLNRPSVGAVILGATKVAQLEDTIGSLAFELSTDHVSALDAASALPQRFPYFMHDSPFWVNRCAGKHPIAMKPPRYRGAI